VPSGRTCGPPRTQLVCILKGLGGLALWRSGVALQTNKHTKQSQKSYSPVVQWDCNRCIVTKVLKVLKVLELDGHVTGRFRATLLLRTTRMRSQRLGVANGVATLQINESTSLLCTTRMSFQLLGRFSGVAALQTDKQPFEKILWPIYFLPCPMKLDN